MPTTPRNDSPPTICSRGIGGHSRPQFIAYTYLRFVEEGREEELHPAGHRIPCFGPEIARILRDGHNAILTRALVDFEASNQFPAFKAACALSLLAECLSGSCASRETPSSGSLESIICEEVQIERTLFDAKSRTLFYENGHEKFLERVPADTVSVHACLMSLLGDAARGRLSDASVVPKISSRDS